MCVPVLSLLCALCRSSTVQSRQAQACYTQAECLISPATCPSKRQKQAAVPVMQHLPFSLCLKPPATCPTNRLTHGVVLCCRSKLSSVCWNSYVKSNLICSDYEGVVQLWDVGQQTETMTFEEHAKRVWSVDFSQVHWCAGVYCGSTLDHSSLLPENGCEHAVKTLHRQSKKLWTGSSCLPA